jgi:hypothetical protein
MSNDPSFCPTCGARVGRSLAERLGIDQDSFSTLIAIVIVGAVLVTITVAIVYGVVVAGQDSRRHEDEMAEKGFVQTTRTIDPSTAFRAGKYVTEWSKPEVQKEEAKKP